MFQTPLQQISKLCQNAGGPLTPLEFNTSFEKSLAGRGRSCRFMIRDDHLLLDKLRQNFLPEAPKVFGNRVWANLYKRQLDLPKAKEFFAKAGFQNPFYKIEDWQGDPHPLIQFSTEPEASRTSDSRPLITLRMLCKPDGTFHAALLVATSGEVKRNEATRQINHPVEEDLAWQVLSLFTRSVDCELGMPGQRSSEIIRF